MSRGWRIFIGVALFVLVILITLALLSYRLLTKSLPRTSGEMKLTVLEDTVRIYRDAYGVPHIFAENTADLFAAAGYVTAQDRLWQMDFNRRAANGELAEIFGEAALESDRYLRTWGFARTARAIVPTLSPESRTVLESYARGVNAFLQENSDRLPVEFALLGYGPRPWRIEDSLAFIRFMGWKLSFGWYIEPVLGQLVEKFGLQKARQIFPGFPEEGPFIISRETAPFWTAATRPFLKAGLELREALGPGGAQLGSNAWAVAGSKSHCGKPMLANDPHLELGAPSIWYETHLSAGDLRVAGVSLPGVPGIVIGHTPHIAWGLTNGMVDDVDFYLEQIHPEDSLQYGTDDGWARMEIVEEPIAVKGADSVNMRIKLTRHGPIISELHPLYQETGGAVALKWVGHEPSDELSGFLKIARARDWQELIEGVRAFSVPAQNFVFASAAGDIGYYLGGTVPIRQEATGLLPHRGWTRRGEWVGAVPFAEMPHVLNPPEGLVVTANNKIIDDRYPYYLSYQWEPPSRAARIRQLLAARESFTLEDFQAIQMDLTSVHALRALVPMLNAVKRQLGTNAAGERLRVLHNLMADWDGVEGEHSVQATLFHAWFLKLIENALKDELGDLLYENYIRLANVPFRVMPRLLEEADSVWWDDVATDTVETRDAIVTRSLLEAEAWLQERYGEPMSHWAWGEVHQLTMRHPLGVRQPLDVLFNLGPFPRGGSALTVNNAEYSLAEPFAARVGASMRQLVDFCDPWHSLSVLPTGQSGQRMSEHYKDQTPLWLEGRYRQRSLVHEEIVREASSVLTLLPK